MTPTAEAPAPAYPQSQVVAHWVVLILIVTQYFMGDQMSDAFRTMLESRADDVRTAPAGVALVHGIFGVLIGLVMLFRLVNRLRHGAPPPPPASRAVQVLGRAVHWLFYAVLLAMPVAGLAAWWLGAGWIGNLHAIASKVLLGLIFLHVAGTAYHHLVLKDGSVVRRMVPSRSDPRY